MRIAAIIIGIDGWEQYTLPLIESIRHNEPLCEMVIVDNASKEPYPQYIEAGPPLNVGFCYTARTQRLCYSAAINFGKNQLIDADWYIVLSNDVICTGPFAHMLEQYNDGNYVVGPLLKEVFGFSYLEGWCVCVPARAWDAVGGWDERFLGSDWEDVDFSTSAREKGFGLIEDTNLPFKHLDQRQRYYIVENFAGKNAHNQNYFLRKHAKVTA